MLNRISNVFLKASMGAALLVGSIAVMNAVPSARAESNMIKNFELNECIGNVCVGGLVEVISGSYQGERGTVTGLDSVNNIVSLVSQSSGEYMYPSFYEVQVTNVGFERCIANICINDYVRIVSGYNSGNSGRVVGVDSYSYSLTILTSFNNYITVSVRDVIEINNYPVPMPRPVPYCPIGTVYDVFRGICIRVMPRPYPVPYPRPAPRPYPVPYPRPAPRPYPVPRPAPRPMPAPAPRPMPRPMPAPAPRPMPRPAPRYEAPRTMPGNGGGYSSPRPMPSHGGNRGGNRGPR